MTVYHQGRYYTTLRGAADVAAETMLPDPSVIAESESLEVAIGSLIEHWTTDAEREGRQWEPLGEGLSDGEWEEALADALVRRIQG